MQRVEQGYAETPNFRQAGIRKNGRLLMGVSHHHAGLSSSSSSIPSKFETILYTGDAEVDGFGSRETRFRSTQKDLPGPGAYRRGRSLVRESDSLSKKGMGVGFVSKVDRFGRSGSLAPGPGAYTNKHIRSFVEEKTISDFNRSRSTSNFSKTTPLKVQLARPPRLGPGDYEPEALQRRRRARRARVPISHSQYMPPQQRKKLLLQTVDTEKHSARERLAVITYDKVAAMKRGGQSELKRRKAKTAPLDEANPNHRHVINARTNSNKFLSQSRRVEPEENMAFLSTTHRRLDLPAAANPSPMDYTPSDGMGFADRSLDQPAANPFHSSEPRKVFEHRTGNPRFNWVPGPGRYRPDEPNDVGHVAPRPGGAIQERMPFNTSVGLDQKNQPVVHRKPQSQTPGPGDYNPERQTLLTQGSAKDAEIWHANPLSSRSTGRMSRSAQRVNHSTALRVSGQQSGLRSAASISALLQREIIASQRIDPPGPGYYSPKGNSGVSVVSSRPKSHHLNVDNVWTS